MARGFFGVNFVQPGIHLGRRRRFYVRKLAPFFFAD